MTRKTITFSNKLVVKISELAVSNDRSFSKQVVHMCKAEVARLKIQHPAISEPKFIEEGNKDDNS